MDHALGIGGQDRPRGGNRLVAAAAHDRERAAFRAGLAAGDRCVDTQDFLVAAFHRDLAGDAGRNRGVVDQHRAGAQAGKGALRAEHHIGQVIVVAHAGDHRVGALGGFGRAAGHARGQAGVGGQPGFAPGIAAVEHGEAVAGLAQVAGDGPAHGAKADAGDGEWFGHAGCLTGLCGRASPPKGCRASPETVSLRRPLH
jgi:hypothetical protein